MVLIFSGLCIILYITVSPESIFTEDSTIIIMCTLCSIHTLNTQLLLSCMQVNENGVVSFGEAWSYSYPSPFPNVPDTAINKIVVAPFWSDNDIRIEGAVRYATYYYQEEGNEIAAELLTRVNEHVRSFQGDGEREFSGTWLLIGIRFIHILMVTLT